VLRVWGCFLRRREEARAYRKRIDNKQDGNNIDWRGSPQEWNNGLAADPIIRIGVNPGAWDYDACSTLCLAGRL
jgi:hypothetical protein